MTPVRYTKAWSLAQEGLPVKPPARVFVRSPAFRTPGEAARWLWDQRCELETCVLHVGPDGTYRGSGEVTR